MKGNFSFKAIGTQWCINIDGNTFKNNEKNVILKHIGNFEKSFSRFLPDSEVNAFRESGAGKYKISDELTVLLERAQKLRKQTGGVYDPAVGQLLERAGYDSKYKMEPSDDTDNFVLPEWSLEKKILSIDGPTSFDLGGTGKGYCIDKVADLVKGFGYKHFAVDGGGDMYVTSKKDGSKWRVAIQYPGKLDTAAGVVELKNEAIAVSDSFRRKWGKWHHVVHPTLKKPIEDVIGVVAVAQNAWDADCMTSALFLSDSDNRDSISTEYDTKYLVFKKDGTCTVSSNWSGDLY
jgi:FAD:protein FMN transferase